MKIKNTKTKEKTKKQRKEKNMPGDTRFVITPHIKRQIIDIIDERIAKVHVTKEDFSELKSIVRDLAEAQKRTGERLEELAEAQKRTEVRLEELAEAQKRTEVRVEELADAQKRTESRLEELALAQKELAQAQKRTEEEVKKLAEGLQDTRIHLGGLYRSFSYAFENEAYRNVPRLLQEQYGYEIKEKMVRAEVGDKEINFFCKAERNGKQIYIVGESKVRLDEGKWRKEIYDELEDKVKAVREVYGDVVIQPILVTHFATKGFIDEAKEKGIIVIQSYEW